MNAGIEVLPANIEARSLRAPWLTMYLPVRCDSRNEIGCLIPLIFIVAANSFNFFSSKRFLD